MSGYKAVTSVKSILILAGIAVLFPASGAAKTPLTFSADGAYALRSGNLNYEEYFFAGSLGLGERLEKRQKEEAPGAALELGGFAATSLLEGSRLDDRGEIGIHFELDPRYFFDRKVRYGPFALWSFIESRLSYDKPLGLELAVSHIGGLGFAARLFGPFWTFSLEQGAGQRREDLATGERNWYLVGYGKAVNSLGQEGQFRVLFTSMIYAEDGPGLPLTENWTLRQVSSLEAPLEGVVSLVVSHEYNYRNLPVEGYGKVDQSFRTGLRVSL